MYQRYDTGPLLKEFSPQSMLPLKGAIVSDYSAILFVDYGLSGFNTCLLGSQTLIMYTILGIVQYSLLSTESENIPSFLAVVP